jgi:hypothetical protein
MATLGYAIDRHGCGRVKVNGVDISGVTRSTNVQTAVGKVPEVVITLTCEDGAAGTVDISKRWPRDLARRLRSLADQLDAASDLEEAA